MTHGLLADSVCNLPCWNNVIPGKTTKDETLRIVNALESVDKDTIRVFLKPTNIFDGEIQFNIGLNEFVATGTEIYLDGDIVAALSFSRRLGVTVGALIDKLGSPENIISMLQVERGSFVTAVYSTQGVGFGFYTDRDGVIQSNTSIDYLILFDPQYYERLLSERLFTAGNGLTLDDIQSHMHSWKGYGEIDKLYPPIMP